MEARHVSQKDIETHGRNDDSQSAVRFSMVRLIFYAANGDSPADYRTDAMNGKLKDSHYREVIMRRLNSFPCVMGLLVAIVMSSMAGLALIGSATAQVRPRVQKQPNINQSFCIPHFGTTTVLARRSGRSVPIQTSTCISGSGNTTVVARPFGSENDKYECVGECRVVRMCLLQYCYNETVCNPCVRVVVVIGRD
jgi:hypothetical protein